jgi:hypothetical protein
MMLGLWVVEEDVDFRCSRPQSLRTQGSDEHDTVAAAGVGFGPSWG